MKVTEADDLTKAKSAMADVQRDILSWGDQRAIWASAILVSLDNFFPSVSNAISKFSPLLARVISNGAYLRALFGLPSIIVPILAVDIGILGVASVGGLLVPPPFWILAGLAILGMLDALAGLLGALTLAIGLGITAGIHSSGDIRMLAGFMMLALAPTFMGSAMRQLKRPATSGITSLWDRIADYAVFPVIAAWSASQIIDVLPALSGLQLDIPPTTLRGMEIAVFAAGLTRVALEQVTNTYFPGRLATNVPAHLQEPTLRQKLISLALRAGSFFYLGSAFVGVNVWVVIGTVLFIIPPLAGLWQTRLPNAPKLFHLMPIGLTSLGLSSILSGLALAVILAITGETPDLAKYAFAFLPVPGFIISCLKLFGRAPRPGDVRWYLRPQLKWFYRGASIAVVAYTYYNTDFLVHLFNINS
jgi:hypothetical protein